MDLIQYEGSGIHSWKRRLQCGGHSHLQYPVCNFETFLDSCDHQWHITIQVPLLLLKSLYPQIWPPNLYWLIWYHKLIQYFNRSITRWSSKTKQNMRCFPMWNDLKYWQWNALLANLPQLLYPQSVAWVQCRAIYHQQLLIFSFPDRQYIKNVFTFVSITVFSFLYCYRLFISTSEVNKSIKCIELFSHQKCVNATLDTKK